MPFQGLFLSPLLGVMFPVATTERQINVKNENKKLINLFKSLKGLNKNLSWAV